MKIKSKQNGRKEWSVTGWSIVGQKEITGTLKCGSVVIRPKFKVKLNRDRTFAVDVGTGSGVKVKFIAPKN